VSTFSSLHYHVTFSTKHRVRQIDQEWEQRLHSYMGGILKKLDGFPQGIGGVEDHVHLLFGLKPTHCISDVLREVKKSSSEWVHNEIGKKDFRWQDGYAVFSVSATARDSVKRYTAGQREHHRVKTFREELIALLERAEIEYDPKYLD